MSAQTYLRIAASFDRLAFELGDPNPVAVVLDTRGAGRSHSPATWPCSPLTTDLRGKLEHFKPVVAFRRTNVISSPQLPQHRTILHAQD